MTKQNEDEREWPESLEWAREAAGRAWTLPFTEDKEMDPLLARAFAVVITQEFTSLIHGESRRQNEAIIRALKLLREGTKELHVTELEGSYAEYIDRDEMFDLIEKHIKEYEDET